MALDAIAELRDFAEHYRAGDLAVNRAVVEIGERQNGESFTHVLLLLDDPAGETWEFSAVRDLRHALGRKATELNLPPVTLTLVPESEADVVEAFAD